MLIWVFSWYEDVDLDKLTTLHEGSAWIDDPELVKKRQALAYDMAQYAPAHTWIPDPNPPAEAKDEGQAEESEEEEAEDESGEESEGNSDEAEEDAEAEVTPGPTPAPDVPSSSGTAGQCAKMLSSKN